MSREVLTDNVRASQRSEHDKGGLNACFVDQGLDWAKDEERGASMVEYALWSC